MLFNSFEYILLFLPITVLIYFYFNRTRRPVDGKLFLLLASLFFYGWWSYKFIPLLLISVLLNYVIGCNLIELPESGTNGKSIKPKIVLWIGISCNIALLGYYKYSGFVVWNINQIFDPGFQFDSKILPLAISFFTFQQIAYLTDSYKGKIVKNDFVHYAAFVTFFPQLIAGPIVRYNQIIPQYFESKNWALNFENINKGVFLFSIGLFKKVIIADTFALWVSNGFDKADTLHLFEAWITSLSYTFQIYFDFSGYTDMAIGAALLFNIRLPQNFSSPYLSLNIQDFWRRWHITLSNFLRDYIYIPLGGNEGGDIFVARNIMITFLLGGLWHGAGWNFVLWGAFHGLALIIFRQWKKFGKKMNKIFAWGLTFLFINFTWVFFRATEFSDSMKVIKGMIGLNGIILPTPVGNYLGWLSDLGINFGGFGNNIQADVEPSIWVVIAFLILFQKNSNQIAQRFVPNRKSAFFASILFAVAFMNINKVSDFLYFNF